MTPTGTLSVNYRYDVLHGAGNFAEAGLSVVVPSSYPEFRWIGEGPYPGYPGKEQLNEFGIFHLNSADLHFQGNRRGTNLALLTNAAGVGVAMMTSPTDVAVERDVENQQLLLNHNVLISSLGNKIGGPETSVSAAKTAEIKGTFTLMFLQSAWPKPLLRWFGHSGPTKKIFRPFYHSYDQ